MSGLRWPAAWCIAVLPSLSFTDVSTLRASSSYDLVLKLAPDPLGPAALDGVQERRPAAFVARLDVGAFVEQQRHHRRLADCGRPAERRADLLVARVRAGAFLQQAGDGFAVAAPDRFQELLVEWRLGEEAPGAQQQGS
jgi:hypothetical protein